MGEQSAENKCIVAVRIRGVISARREARETLKLLRLTRNNYAVLINNRPSFVGMLNAVRNYVTWGEASKEVVSMLIGRRGRLSGNKRLAEEYLRKVGYNSVEDLAEALFSCRAEYWKLSDVQPAFRLSPPTKGFRGNIKKGYGAGGELGYRGEKINDLVKRMV